MKHIPYTLLSIAISSFLLTNNYSVNNKTARPPEQKTPKEIFSSPNAYLKEYSWNNSFAKQKGTRNEFAKNENVLGKDTIRILAIYNSQGFLNAFMDFEKECKAIRDSAEKTYKQPTLLKIIGIENERFEAGDDTTKRIKKVKERIDREMTSFVKKHGKINYEILGFHSYAKEMKLNRYIYTDEEYRVTQNNIMITNNELKTIAEKNKLSKELFTKDAIVIFKACSAGKGENSIAETFSKSYSVTTIAPTKIYAGKLTWHNKQPTLESKKFYLENDSLNYCALFKGPKNHNYALLPVTGELNDLTRDKLVTIEELVQNKTINISDADMEKSFLENDIFEKMKYWGFKLIKKDVPIQSLMEIRRFEP